MAPNYEDEADAYYSAKKTYTELLHKAALELPEEAGPPKSNDSAKESDGRDMWFLQGSEDTAPLAELVKELADLMKDIETPEKQPQEAESKAKSKGKKK